MVFFLVYSIYIFTGKQPRNLTLNCCLFSFPYNIWLLMCFKKSRRLFFFFMTVMFLATIEVPNITIKKCSSIFDTYILIENLLLIVPYDIYEIALLQSVTCYIHLHISLILNHKYPITTTNTSQIPRCHEIDI